MRRMTILMSAVLCAAGVAQGQVQNGNANFVGVPGSMELSGRVIVRPHQANDLAARGLSRQRIAQMGQSAMAEIAQHQLYLHEPMVDHHVLVVPGGMGENQFINRLVATGFFEFVEPDWTLFPIGCPDDSGFGNQWHHDASKMQSCDAWDLFTGNPSVTVGICDTGVQTSHPDLQLNRQEGYNAVDRLWESQGGDVNPVHWHGTATTGCAAANGDNGQGVAGTGWNLGHRMMRVSNSSNGSAALSTLTHAALTSIQRGDRVANVSYSGVNSSSVRSAATQIKSMGGLLTWSAGNDGANLNWGDRDNDDVIVVGATTSSDNKSSFSAYGASVDLVAPGSSVYTTYTGSGYASVSGTSFSAPLTAGLIALIWSADPSLTPDQVEGILKAGCDDLGAGGVDNTYGHGRINSFGSLSLLGGGGNTPPSVTISSPANGSTYAEGDSVTFTGAATDNEDGDLTASITWTSNLDGAIGAGAGFSTSALSVGTHVVTADVTDSGNASGDDTVTVMIEPPAGAVPNAPSNPAASDNADGSATVTWDDNADNETGFGLQRQKQKKNGTWRSTVALSAGADATSLTDASGTGTFRYRVRATNGTGDSAWTAWVTVTVTGGGGGGGGGGGNGGGNGNGHGKP